MSEEQTSLSCDESNTFIYEEHSSENDSMSSDGLEIDISESPTVKKEIDIVDKSVLENIEEEIERQYDDKAAKSNLTAVNVKNILKHVITNEHVLAMVRNTMEENSPEDYEQSVYEPKLTRAKAKELFKNTPGTTIPWASPAPKSETHILINEELQEDSDDDEYVPHEESEDEKDSVHPSDVDSQPATPATPTSSLDTSIQGTPTHETSTQTVWTEDGVFKVPPPNAIPKTPTQERSQETNENIALRTRSKLSLSDTPLEIIEEAFIPPDITTDMYDLECDDEDWRDFLKKFTRPLDEAVTGTQEDDDEADPEYNVLSDEEIDKLDKEELRQDKGVKVTKKELNTLVAELFEFSEIFSNTYDQESQQNNNEQISQETHTESNIPPVQNISESNVQPSENVTISAPQIFIQTPENLSQNTSQNFPQTSTENLTQPETSNNNASNSAQSQQLFQVVRLESIPVKKDVITSEQMMLFEQQMRQHVQMLTQNYILSYKHVYFDDLSGKFKDMLLSLSELAKYRTITAFRPFNLNSCLEFVKEWDEMIVSNTKEVQEMLQYVAKIFNECKRCDENKHEYVVHFPKLLLKKVSESPAFIYPALLPKIPFRPPKNNTKTTYLKSENELIALGLEQFNQYLSGKLLFKTRNGRIRNVDICNYICTYMLPNREPKKLNWYINRMKHEKIPNPIKYYFANEKAPVSMHYVCSLEQFGALPPRMRPKESLPYQWKMFLYPEESTPQSKPKSPSKLKPKKVTKPPAYKKPTKKTVVNILPAADPTDSLPTLVNFNKSSALSPVLIINNAKEARQKCEVKNTSILTVPSTSIHKQNLDKVQTAQKSQNRRKTIILPRLEEIFIRTSEYYISNSEEIVDIIINTDETIQKEKQTKVALDISKLKFNSTIFKRLKDDDMLPSMPFLLTPGKNQRILNLEEPDVEEPDHDPLEVDNLKNEGENSKIKDDTSSASSAIEENLKTTEDISITIEESSIHTEHSIISEKFCTVAEILNPVVDSLTTEQNETLVENNEKGKDNKKDDEAELNALMVASSTMQQKNRRLQPNLTKKAKQMREYNATLAMLCPEDQNSTEEKAKNFAQAYYDKVQERLESASPIEYQKFMEALSEHDETRSSVPELYEKVSSVLSPKHPDLCEEFLTFLTPAQAQQIGKLVPHFMLSNMSLFLRKLEIYYCNQPAQLRKIYNSLTELADTAEVTMDRVKSTILPLLKGNSLLIDWFLQMFPQESPPESMMKNWEQLDGDDEDIDDDDKIFETLTLPEVEDPYGGPNCICKCHNIDDEMFKTRNRHCIPCGTKFLQGRVYVQTGKSLRLANVTFNGSPNSGHVKRLNVQKNVRRKRKSETSPSKILMSPTKDDEPRHSNESEDDINTENSHKKMKTLKTFRNSSPSKPRKKPTVRTPKSNKKETISKNKTKPETSSPNKKVVKQTKNQQKKETTKIETKEPNKQEINEGEKTAESETEEIESMDTCEESSQDTLEESDDSLEEIESGNSEDSNSPLEMEVSEGSNIWTRDEDKVILQSFQKGNNDNEKVFKYIQKNLSGRSETEIRQRFQVLMTMLQDMAKKNS